MFSDCVLVFMCFFFRAYIQHDEFVNHVKYLYNVGCILYTIRTYQTIHIYVCLATSVFTTHSGEFEHIERIDCDIPLLAIELSSVVLERSRVKHIENRSILSERIKRNWQRNFLSTEYINFHTFEIQNIVTLYRIKNQIINLIQ